MDQSFIFLYRTYFLINETEENIKKKKKILKRIQISTSKILSPSQLPPHHPNRNRAWRSLLINSQIPNYPVKTQNFNKSNISIKKNVQNSYITKLIEQLNKKLFFFFLNDLKMAVFVGVHCPRTSGDQPNGQEGQVQRRQRPIRFIQSDTIRSGTRRHVHFERNKAF